MATLAEVNGLVAVLRRVTSPAERHVGELVRAVAELPPPDQRDALAGALMDVLGPVMAQVEDLAGQFYLEDRDLRSRPPVVPSAPVDLGRIQALAGWTTALLGEDPAVADAVSRAQGGSTRIMWDVQRDVTMTMGAQDGARYQRMAQPGCCAFCAMLASRGAVYSAGSVTRVVGRGVPLGRDQSTGKRVDGKRRGRTGKGIVSRGVRPLGELYHDDCRCVGVALHEGRAQQMHDTAEKWLDIYRDAYAAANTKFEYANETWKEKVTYKVNGKDREFWETRSRYFWVDDRKGTKGYGDEVRYEAFQKQLVADMRRIAAKDYGLALK